jgi:hypothetical protein
LHYGSKNCLEPELFFPERQYVDAFNNGDVKAMVASR